jgi:hypothetical protein
MGERLYTYMYCYFYGVTTDEVWISNWTLKIEILSNNNSLWIYTVYNSVQNTLMSFQSAVSSSVLW